MAELRDAEAICREALRAGATREEIIGLLNASGANILDAIKSIRAVFSVSLGEAKRLVTGHPAWRAEVRAAESLHDAAEWAAKVGRERDGE